MVGGSYSSMAAMMGMGGNAGAAPIPTQTFSSANFIGTPVPQVGDATGRPAYASAVGGVSQSHVVIVAVVLIGLGYLLYHISFEK